MQSFEPDMFTEKINFGALEFGDSMLSDYQISRLFNNNVPIGEVAVKDEKLRWTNAVIPYEIDCSISKDFDFDIFLVYLKEMVCFKHENLCG